MALYKQITSESGCVTSYHSVSAISLHEDVLNCTVNSYVSSEYRALDRPAHRQFFSFNITVEEEESMGIRQLVYAKIKALPEWEGAEDC